MSKITQRSPNQTLSFTDSILGIQWLPNKKGQMEKNKIAKFT